MIQGGKRDERGELVDERKSQQKKRRLCCPARVSRSESGLSEGSRRWRSGGSSGTVGRLLQ